MIVFLVHAMVHVRAVLSTDKYFSLHECVSSLKGTTCLNVLRAHTQLTLQRAALHASASCGASALSAASVAPTAIETRDRT